MPVVFAILFINFDIYGMYDNQPIWAENFINKVSNSSMGLNLSRGKPVKYYLSLIHI